MCKRSRQEVADNNDVVIKPVKKAVTYRHLLQKLKESLTVCITFLKQYDGVKTDGLESTLDKCFSLVEIKDSRSKMTRLLNKLDGDVQDCFYILPALSEDETSRHCSSVHQLAVSIQDCLDNVQLLPVTTARERMEMDVLHYCTSSIATFTLKKGAYMYAICEASQPHTPHLLTLSRDVALYHTTFFFKNAVCYRVRLDEDVHFANLSWLLFALQNDSSLSFCSPSLMQVIHQSGEEHALHDELVKNLISLGFGCGLHSEEKVHRFLEEKVNYSGFLTTNWFYPFRDLKLEFIDLQVKESVNMYVYPETVEAEVSFPSGYYDQDGQQMYWEAPVKKQVAEDIMIFGSLSSETFLPQNADNDSYQYTEPDYCDSLLISYVQHFMTSQGYEKDGKKLSPTTLWPIDDVTSLNIDHDVDITQIQHSLDELPHPFCPRVELEGIGLYTLLSE